MFFNYEEQAKNHEPVPDGLSLFDEGGYRSLSEIYEMYQKGTITREQAVNTIDGILKNELQQNVILSEHGANCPCCRRFFNREHADRRPRFCEDCGAMLVW